MRVFHGSNVEIIEINLNKCRPYKDFGAGFYLTEMKEQAQRMAQRVARLYGGTPVVNVFEIPDNILEFPGLNCIIFGNQVSRQWATFVLNNRNRNFTDFTSVDCNHDNKYDIVYGPVANDNMAMLFRQFENDLIDFELLVQGLTFRTSTNQISFHTEKAIRLLHNIGVLHE